MAVRIAGVTIPSNKRVEIALTYVLGIGKSRSNEILQKTGINQNAKVVNLTDEDVNKLRLIIEKEYKIEGDLKREVIGNIKRLKEINCYRGARHTRNLPVRGQRSKTNSRTVRGNIRKTMGSGRQPTAKKT